MTDDQSCKSDEHPPRSDLEAFVQGTLEESERQRLEMHVSDCSSCCELLRSIPEDPLVQRLRTVESASLIELSVSEVEFDGSGPIQNLPREMIEHPRYRILEPLGAGGMGVVYRARHRMMDRDVALKVVNHRFVNSPEAVKRFHQEVKAASRLTHRNIVTAYDAEQAGDLHFLAMEFVDGTNLSELVKRRGPLPILHACNYAMQAAQGLQHAMEQGMVHRDIKPHNLMWTQKGTIKILDFGLARFATDPENPDSAGAGLTRDGIAMGTPDYIAPEQARDARKADIRSDIYSLGATLFYLLTGRVLFPKGTATEKIISHCEQTPDSIGDLRDDVPEGLAAIVDRMLAKDPEDRFQTPAEVVEALKPFGSRNSANSEQETRADDQASSIAFGTQQDDRSDTRQTKQDPSAAADQVPDFSFPQIPAAPLPQGRVVSPRTPGWNQFPKWLFAVGAGLLVLILVLVFWPGTRDDNGFDQDAKQARGSDTIPGDVRETGQWQDLLDAANSDYTVIVGDWTVSESGLVVSAMDGARVRFNFQPPTEYDFQVEFTRHSGEASIALIFVAGEGQAVFDIDAWNRHLAGIQLIDGQALNENPDAAEVLEIDNGTPHLATVRVRRDRVETWIDGRHLTTYRGNGSNLSVLGLWDLSDPTAIGIGAWNSHTTFHRVRLRRLDDR